MKHSISPEDLSLLNQGLAATGIQLSAAPGAGHSHPVPCRFIDNPDGSLRWLWPQPARRANFLKCYYTGNLRAKTAAFLIRLALFCGLGRLVISGSTTLYINERGARKLMQLQDWALFTGTVGITRKLIGWVCDGSGARFIKMPLNDLAASNLHHELMALQEPAVPGMVRPDYFPDPSPVLIQSDLYAHKQWKVPHTIGDLPRVALQRWLVHDLDLAPLQTANWWKAAKRKLDYLQRGGSQRFSELLTGRLEQLMASFRPDTPVAVAPAHGDFTPWNIRCNRVDIAAVDWELYDGNRPALYDLFHFIYQDTVLVRRGNYTGIRRQLDVLLAQPEWQRLLSKHQIDAAVAEQLYLIHTVSYYLDLYIRQETCHRQVKWLLQVWCEALGYCLQQKKHMSSRETVLDDLVHYLRDTPYAVIKLDADEISALPAGSDLDLCLGRTDARALVSWLATHTQVVSCKEKRFSFMRRLTLVLQDHSFLHIDCIWAIRRKNITFMRAKEIIASADQLPSGVKVARTEHEVTYTWLFHLLNNASVPVRHAERFLGSLPHRIVIDRLLRRYAPATPSEQFLLYNQARRDAVLQQIRAAYKSNRGIRYGVNTLRYLLDTCRQLRPGRGYIITFSGVDGAGKSTVISHIARSIDKELRMPVVILRHRPSLLPILSAWKYGKAAAEKRVIESLPRTGRERPGIRSWIRFAYYYSDYLLGQLYIQVRYVYRGYAVLYDRYYFDFISDSRRSNLVVPSWLSYGLYRFLLKPNFNYFLFAPTETILGRKQELDGHTINALNRKYLLLFTRLREHDALHTYNAVCNINLETTLQTIFSNIKSNRLCNVS